MAAVTICPRGHDDVPEGAMVCPTCLAPTVRADAPASVDPPTETPNSAPMLATDASTRVDVDPDPDQPVPAPDTTPDLYSGGADGTAGAAAAHRCWNCRAASPDPQNTRCPACLEDLTAPPALLLRFTEGGQVRLGRGETAVLGRDPGQSEHAVLFATHDNVSRRHATVGVEADGEVWIRDHQTPNGTFVNNSEIVPGQRMVLYDRDTVRLAADVVARVQIPAKGITRRGGDN